jgi:hypothetical protein
MRSTIDIINHKGTVYIVNYATCTVVLYVSVYRPKDTEGKYAKPTIELIVFYHRL